jgi:DNA modification methylase
MPVRILQGDCREMLQSLPDESVHCCVTSPPYFNLRDYNVAGQIGLESRPEEYVEALVGVFREVRRVLRKDGTLWLNLGDSYASRWPCNRRNVIGSGSLANGKREARPERMGWGLKDKDLMLIPHRVAMALQEDGWWLRSDTVWHKPNPMPESVRDRPTRAHEYLFLLAKSQGYYYDATAIREPGVIPAGTKAAKGSAERCAQPGVNSRPPEYKVYDGWRNKRSVWQVSTRPYKGAHFATMPPALVEPCILAGCPPGGVVLDPFAGSGTVGEVAAKHGRDAILVELNPEYVKLIEQRVGLFVEA